MLKLDLSQLRTLFSSAALDLKDSQLQRFLLYHQELLAGNQKASLISGQDEGRIVERHFIESALLSLFDEFRGNKEVLDLGTGAGFPGLPLKIAQPALRLTLLDSKKKKIGFLSELLPLLNLQDVKIMECRAEDLGCESSFQQRYDIIVTRAVARLDLLLTYARPLLRRDGCLISIKGSGVQNEIEVLLSVFGDTPVDVRELPGNPFPVSRNLKVVFVRCV